MELLKGLIKWIILIILFIIIVTLIIKFANRNDTTKNQKKEPAVNVVENNNTSTDTDTDTTNTNNNTEDDGLEPIQENLTVDSPDTASTGIKETILGILIISGGFIYIHKCKTIKGNS